MLYCSLDSPSLHYSLTYYLVISPHKMVHLLAHHTYLLADFASSAVYTLTALFSILLSSYTGLLTFSLATISPIFRSLLFTSTRPLLLWLNTPLSPLSTVLFILLPNFNIFLLLIFPHAFSLAYHPLFKTVLTDLFLARDQRFACILIW